MGLDIKIVEEPKQQLTMNPKKFAMWLFMVTVFMIFAALSSAYIVRQAEGNWTIFDLPSLFWVNTAVILLSSATLHWVLLSWWVNTSPGLTWSQTASIWSEIPQDHLSI
jgi:cytochrome c oxidase subunit III